MTRHLLTVEVAQPKPNDRYRYDGQASWRPGPVTTAPDGQVGFPPGTYRIFYDAESAGEEYGFEFNVGDAGNLQIGEPFKRDPADPNYTAPADLRRVTGQGNDTGLPILTAGYMAYGFPDADEADYMLVEESVLYQNQSVRRIARRPITDLTVPINQPVWAFVTTWEQVTMAAVEAVWAFVNTWKQMALSAPTLPAAPSEVRAIRTAGTRNAVLSWRDNASDENGYEIQVSTDNVTFTPLYSVGANITVLPLNGLPLFTLSYYQVRSVNGAGQSDWVKSNKLILLDYSVTFGLYGQGTPPPYIRQLLAGSISVTPGMGNFGAVVTLPGGSAPTAADYDKVSFDVLFPDGVRHGWNFPDAAASGDPYFSELRPDGYALPAGRYDSVFTIYQYDQPIQVIPFSWSLSPQPVKPTKPSAFTATRATDQPTKVDFAWKDESNNEDTFDIWFKRPTDDVFSSLLSAGANQTSGATQISPLPEGSQFEIRAANGAGSSDWVTVTLTEPAPIIITQVRARRLAATSELEIEAITTRPDRVLWRFSTNANEVLTNQFPDVNQPALGEPLRLGFNSAASLFVAARPLTNVYGAVGRFAITNPPDFSTSWQLLTALS